MLVSFWIISVTFRASDDSSHLCSQAASWHFCAGVFRGLLKDTVLPGCSQDAHKPLRCANTKQLPNIFTWMRPWSLICGGFLTLIWLNYLHSSPPQCHPERSSLSLSLKPVLFEGIFWKNLGPSPPAVFSLVDSWAESLHKVFIINPQLILHFISLFAQINTSEEKRVMLTFFCWIDVPTSDCRFTVKLNVGRTWRRSEGQLKLSHHVWCYWTLLVCWRTRRSLKWRLSDMGSIFSRSLKVLKLELT